MLHRQAACRGFRAVPASAALLLSVLMCEVEQCWMRPAEEHYVSLMDLLGCCTCWRALCPFKSVKSLSLHVYLCTVLR